MLGAVAKVWKNVELVRPDLEFHNPIPKHRVDLKMEEKIENNPNISQ